MQINNTQDYVTRRKRQLIAATYYTTPPPQQNKWNSVYLSTVGNNATTRQRVITPIVSAWGSVPGIATYVNWCSSCEKSLGATGVFQTVNTKDIVSRQALRPIG